MLYEVLQVSLSSSHLIYSSVSIWPLAFRHWGEGNITRGDLEMEGKGPFRFQCRGHCAREEKEGQVSRLAPNLTKWGGKESCQCWEEFEGED